MNETGVKENAWGFGAKTAEETAPTGMDRVSASGGLPGTARRDWFASVLSGGEPR